MRPTSKMDPLNTSVPSRQSSAFRALLTLLVVSVSLAGCGGGSMADLKAI